MWWATGSQECRGMRCQVGRYARISHNLSLHWSKFKAACLWLHVGNLHLHCTVFGLLASEEVPTCLSSMAHLWKPVQLCPVMNYTCIQSWIKKSELKKWRGTRNSLSEDQRLIVNIYFESHTTTQPHQREKWCWRVFGERGQGELGSHLGFIWSLTLCSQAYVLNMH